MSRAGERILRSARQALAFAQGRTDVSQYGVHLPEDIDVRLIRNKVGMTREALARCFGIDGRTVQDWEQGLRMPVGAARTLLTVMSRAPDAVQRALAPIRRRESQPRPVASSHS